MKEIGSYTCIKCSPDKTGHCAFCGRLCEDKDGNYIPRESMKEKPKYPCPNCGRYEWYLPGDYYYGPKRWLCGRCTPPPGTPRPETIYFEGGKIVHLPAETCPKGRKGRPALNIPLDLIYDTLQNSENIKDAAEKLGCSRGYIYKVAGVEKVRELVKT